MYLETIDYSLKSDIQQSASTYRHLYACNLEEVMKSLFPTILFVTALVSVSVAHAKTEAECDAEVRAKYPSGSLVKSSRAEQVKACVKGVKPPPVAKAETFGDCIKRMEKRGDMRNAAQCR